MVCKEEFWDKFCFTASVSDIDSFPCYWLIFKIQLVNSDNSDDYRKKKKDNQQILVDKLAFRYMQAIPTSVFWLPKKVYILRLLDNSWVK